MQSNGENKQTVQFAENLSANRARVLAYVLTRVGTDRTLAEDVTQDCFVQVWKAREHNPPPSGALYSYLVRTAQNILRDRHRRKGHVPTQDWDDIQPGETATPEKQLVLRETMERIAAQMALLPHLLRETLHLRVVEEWDYTAIAAHMNCPIGTVRSRIHAARARIQGALFEQEKISAPQTRMLIRTTTVLYRRENDTNKEVETMANSDDALRVHVEAMEVRIRALENAAAHSPRVSTDVWEAPRVQVTEGMEKERKEKSSVFALGLVHMVMQIADQGTMGTALGVRTMTTVKDLPQDDVLAKRLERMRQLTTDVAVPRIFRYFYALRFDNKDMRATAAELSEAVGENEEKVTQLLKPLVADRTLLLVNDGSGKETYEWHGNDAAITTLLFATT